MIEITTIVLAGYLTALVLGDVYLILAHLILSRSALSRENDDISSGAGFASHCPAVCVQLPLHNEPQLAGEAIDALCTLDWPKNRLEVMVLDDSTDGTLKIVQDRAKSWRARGRQVEVMHRENRREHKAGALAAGLSQTKARYIAVFDADYRPAPGRLGQMMCVLLADPGLAFVQARIDHLNRDRNWLTRAQAMELDTQLAFEHAARNWAGIPMIFNGTCGVWRREAIEAAGGWSGRSVGEDQDLSFRAYALGWRSRFLATVPVPGELPESIAALLSQRQRWMTGTAQVLRQMPRRLSRHLNWHQAAAFWALCQFNATSAFCLVLTALAAASCWLIEPANAPSATLALLGAIGEIVAARTTGSLLAACLTGRRLDHHLAFDILVMWVMQALLLPAYSLSFLRGTLSNRSTFVRTPKRGYSDRLGQRG